MADKATTHTMHFLRMEIEALKHDNERYLNINSDLATENAALAKRVEVLQRACQPLYEAAVAVEGSFTGDPENYLLWRRISPDGISSISYGDCLKAKAALEDK